MVLKHNHRTTVYTTLDSNTITCSFSIRNAPVYSECSITKGRFGLMFASQTPSDAGRQRGFIDSHYKALKRMQDILGFEYRFQVLAFPCNQFGEQERGTNYDIKNFLYENYRVESPVFSKIDVIGDNSHPAFRNLVAKSSIHPEWNFYKYLDNPEGRVIKAWSTKVTIDEIFSDVKRAVEEAGKDNTTKFQIKEEVFSEERNRSSDEVLLNAEEDSKIPKPVVVNESVKDEL
ncbi:glutathione peroxidase 7-like [Artemia franciscana]|uniref:glutathione peroxidase 7-like n=1 Tax=Artemia franciscana TaxID=6661 RepID=UPI0032DBA4BB